MPANKEANGSWTVQCYYGEYNGSRKKKKKRGFSTKKAALEWEREFLVQQQKLDTYFNNSKSADLNRLLDIKEMNARARTSNRLLELAKMDTISTKNKKLLISKASEILTGEQIIPFEDQTTMTATEVGKKVGASASVVEYLTNAHNFKTDKYGEWHRSKSQSSNKEVDTFVYYDSILPVLESILKVGGEKGA